MVVERYNRKVKFIFKILIDIPNKIEKKNCRIIYLSYKTIEMLNFNLFFKLGLICLVSLNDFSYF